MSSLGSEMKFKQMLSKHINDLQKKDNISSESSIYAWPASTQQQNPSLSLNSSISPVLMPNISNDTDSSSSKLPSTDCDLVTNMFAVQDSNRLFQMEQLNLMLVNNYQKDHMVSGPLTKEFSLTSTISSSNSTPVKFSRNSNSIKPRKSKFLIIFGLL